MGKKGSARARNARKRYLAHRKAAELRNKAKQIEEQAQLKAKEQNALLESQKKEQQTQNEQKKEQAHPEQKKEQQVQPEQKKEQEVQPEQKKEQQTQNEQKKEQAQPEQKKEQEVQPEQKKEQEVQPEQKKEQQTQNEQKKEQAQPEQKKEQQVQTEQKNDQVVQPEQKKEQEVQPEQNQGVSPPKSILKSGSAAEKKEVHIEEPPKQLRKPPGANSSAPVLKKMKSLGTGALELKRNKSGSLSLKSSALTVALNANDFVTVKEKPIEEDSIIVIDNGSSFIKVGVTGEEVPRFVIPTLVYKNPETGKFLCGYDALNANSANAINPLDPRKPVNWDMITILWKYIFYKELNIDPYDHCVVVSELPFMSTPSKKAMEKIFFDDLCVPGMKIMNSAISSLFASGNTSGLIVSVGNRLQVVPVIDTCPIDSAIYTLKAGFAEVTDYFARLLTSSGIFAKTKKDLEEIRHIKEKYCYVAVDFAAENKKRIDEIEVEVTFNGKKYKISRERYECPEALFNPKLMGLDIPSLAEIIIDVVNKCPIDNRSTLLSHIILTGGSTLFPNFAARLEHDVSKLLDSSRASKGVHVIRPPNRKYLAWSGMSAMAVLPSFMNNEIKWVEDYHIEDDYVPERIEEEEDEEDDKAAEKSIFEDVPQSDKGINEELINH